MEINPCSYCCFCRNTCFVRSTMYHRDYEKVFHESKYQNHEALSETWGIGGSTTRCFMSARLEP